jgi:hypothetical protein
MPTKVVEMKPSHRRLSALLGLLFGAGLACQLPTTTSGQVDPTALAEALVAAQNATIVAGLTETAALPAPELPAEGTATPTETATSAETATTAATISTSPSARLIENTHCRKGPLAAYDLVITYLNGQLLDILGKNAAGDYWFVSNPNNPSANCWLWGRYAQVSGDTSQVPVFTPPPTPTPNLTPTPAWQWAGTWGIWIDAAFLDQFTQSLTLNGNQVSGTVNVGAGPESLTGTTGQGWRDVSGVIPGRSLTFQWHMLDSGDQFIGSFYNTGDKFTGPYCGSRNGQPRPSPCQWP